MYVEFKSSDGSVGDIKKANGLNYCKSKNGKWLLVRDKHLKKLLKTLHVNQGKTLRKIHEETKIPHSTIQKALNDFGLMRSKKQYSADFNEFVEKNHDRLLSLYAEKEMTSRDIAELVKQKTGKSFKPIMFTRYFDKHIDRRTHSEAIEVATKKGRRRKPTSEEMLLRQSSIDAWNNHLDRSLQGLTFKQYKRIVHRFTYMVVKRFPQFVEPDARREARIGSDIELDHQFSKSNGYYVFDGNDYVPRERPVSLEIICHPLNFKLMTSKSNSIKSSSNHIELDELEKRIAEFEKEHGDIFEDYYGS